MITNVTLSTKERYLLEDEKTHEEQCILKYDNYANLASDAQLKAVFRANGQKEREHLETINQLLAGKVPSMAGQGQSQAASGQSNNQNQTGQAGSIQSQQSTINNSGTAGLKMSDKDMCIDMLSTEKYISGTYDTAIFEFTNAQVRDVLNHIQKEEQKHGEAISAYMQSKGMYTVK
jgi:spore coat protein CotF